MFYEMKSNETLGTLLRYAGGFKGDAYTRAVRVLRKSGRELSIYNVNEFDLSSFTIADEDSVIVDSVLTRYENMVEVKGAVFDGKVQIIKHFLVGADGDAAGVAGRVLEISLSIDDDLVKGRGVKVLFHYLPLAHYAVAISGGAAVVGYKFTGTGQQHRCREGYR